MLTIELVPINKGNPVIVDDTTIKILGRTPSIGCSDVRISRKHAEFYMKSDGTIWIKPIHHNPIFYKTKSNQLVSLIKDKEYQLYPDDQFGLLPDEYFYRITIHNNDKQIEKIIELQEQTVLEQSSEKENQTLPTNISQNDEVFDSSSSTPTPTTDIESNHSNLTSNPSLRKRIRPGDYRPNENIVDDPPTTSSSTVEQLNVTDNSNLTSSTTVKTRRRERCAYGNSCYRTNPIHRQEASHPGDSDYDSDNEEQTKPECPFGNECYRKNPEHLEEYSHSRKRKANNDEIDEDTVSTDDDSSNQDGNDDDDNDSEWEPEDNSQKSNRNYDDTTDESDKELTKREAEEFIKHRSMAKKARFDDE